jgi:uncharacterized membrane protein
VHDLLLFAGAFLASAVEAVEALTIVLAVGVTRGWRPALSGAGVALGALVLIVGVLGPAVADIPIDALRVVVGTALLIFGLQWLRKAVLRASDVVALHDEKAVFREEVSSLRQDAPESSHDWYAFVVAFKGVFLEGLEVAFIVVTVAGSRGSALPAAAGAAVAIVLVVLAGCIARAPLARVPENALKFAVGVLLTAFGVFWAAEGAGVSWPLGEAAIPVLVAYVAAAAGGLVALARAGLARAGRRAPTAGLSRR